MVLYLRYIVNQLFVCRLAKILAFVQLRMSAPVRKISKVHSVSSPRIKVAMISHPLRWTRRLFVTGHWNAYRPATMVSLSPMEKRNWKWLATLEVGYTVSSRRESFRKFLIVYVITYNCLIIVHQATTQFLVSVTPYDRFPQTYAIHLAQTEEDAWLTTFVSVPKGSEDRNAITVGAFDFNRVKKKKTCIVSGRVNFLCYAILSIQLVMLSDWNLYSCRELRPWAYGFQWCLQLFLRKFFVKLLCIVLTQLRYGWRIRVPTGSCLLLRVRRSQILSRDCTAVYIW